MDETVQTKLQLSVYADVLRDRVLPRIRDLDFSRFPLGDADGCRQCGGVRDGGALRSQDNNVVIHFSKRNAAEALSRTNNRRRTGVSSPGRTLLVTMYPADANAYPGNQFWDGDGKPLAAPDAALDAACSCTMGDLHCAEINPCVSGVFTKWYVADDEHEADHMRRARQDSVTLASGGGAGKTTQFARAKKSLLKKHNLDGLGAFQQRASLFA